MNCGVATRIGALCACLGVVSGAEEVPEVIPVASVDVTAVVGGTKPLNVRAHQPHRLKILGNLDPNDLRFVRHDSDLLLQKTATENPLTLARFEGHYLEPTLNGIEIHGDEGGRGALPSVLAGRVETDAHSVIQGWASNLSSYSSPVSLLIRLESLHFPGFIHWRTVHTHLPRPDLITSGQSLFPNVGFFCRLATPEGGHFAYEVMATIPDLGIQRLIGKGNVSSGQLYPARGEFNVGGNGWAFVPYVKMQLRVRLKLGELVISEAMANLGRPGALQNPQVLDADIGYQFSEYSTALMPGDHLVRAFLVEAENGDEVELEGSPRRLLAGSTSDDVIECQPTGSWVEGLDGDDSIMGSDESDYVRLGAGDDRVEGRGGDDRVDGAWGNDHIDLGAGDDECAGGPGDDVLDGGAGDDVFYYQSGDGHDQLIDSEGQNRLILVELKPANIVSDERDGTLRVIRFEKEGVLGSITIRDAGISETMRLVFN